MWIDIYRLYLYIVLIISRDTEGIIWGPRCKPSKLATQQSTVCITYGNTLNHKVPGGLKTAIWRNRSGSILVYAMVYCITHHTITWTNVDWSSRVFTRIYLGAISQEVPMNYIICIFVRILRLSSLIVINPRSDQLVNLFISQRTYELVKFFPKNNNTRKCLIHYVVINSGWSNSHG